MSTTNALAAHTSTNYSWTSVIDHARNELLIIAPRIDLDDEEQTALAAHFDKPDFKLTVVFGKSTGGFFTALNPGSLRFLKRFANMEIRYNARLNVQLCSCDASIDAHRDLIRQSEVMFKSEAQYADSGFLHGLTSIHRVVDVHVLYDRFPAPVMQA